MRMIDDVLTCFISLVCEFCVRAQQIEESDEKKVSDAKLVMRRRFDMNNRWQGGKEASVQYSTSHVPPEMISTSSPLHVCFRNINHFIFIDVNIDIDSANF